MKNYTDEREGQIDFLEAYLALIDKNLDLETVLADNNDGVIRGTILEFKTHINDLNRVLFQAIKYLSARRIKGKPVPAQILLVSLNDEIAYLYKSEKYLAEIEKPYVGAASKGNEGFLGESPEAIYHYGSNKIEQHEMIQALRIEQWTKIHIDANCIVGWAEHYYRLKKGARKADFLGDKEGKVKIVGEIREPSLLKDYIHPYTGKTNVRFNYLMDQLNDFIAKKDLGAFYTPDAYAKKAVELVRQAIARVPEGNDYIILDRCAGTGNLERFLNEDELSHVILSTLEYYEYKVMFELLGDKVRHIVPPVEDDSTFVSGMVRGSDALSKEFIENPVIKSYLDDPNCTIILFENVPFAEPTSMEHQKTGTGKKSSSAWKQSYVMQEMKKSGVKGATLNDLGNLFIWSGFRYYLRQPTDSYVLFSPIKYWKAQHLISKKFLNGFAGDRAQFHARKHVCVCVILWSNEDDPNLDQFDVDGYDIDADGNLSSVGKLSIAKVHSTFSQKYYDKRPIPESNRKGVLFALNGIEHFGGSQREKAAFGKPIIAYLAVYGTGFDQPDLHCSLLIGGRYDGNGFYLREDNYLYKLPMFAAGRYISHVNKWTERGRVMKSGDGSQRFETDSMSGKLDQWLLKCLLFTCMEYQNHLRTYLGSDNRLYRNELCLDTTNGETLASENIKSLICSEQEKEILVAWNSVLNSAKKCSKYNANLTYGLYQIGEELDTSHKDPETDETIYDYPELHGHIQSLKSKIKVYYFDEIVPTLFEYEFLK